MIRENAEILFKTKKKKSSGFFFKIRNITRNVIHEINARIINFPQQIHLSLKNEKKTTKKPKK